MSVPDEGYSNNASYTLYLISTFLLLSPRRYLCWWTISPRWYHPPSSQCFGTDMISTFFFSLIFLLKNYISTTNIHKC